MRFLAYAAAVSAFISDADSLQASGDGFRYLQNLHQGHNQAAKVQYQGTSLLVFCLRRVR